MRGLRNCMPRLLRLLGALAVVAVAVEDGRNHHNVVIGPSASMMRTGGGGVMRREDSAKMASPDESVNDDDESRNDEENNEQGEDPDELVNDDDESRNDEEDNEQGEDDNEQGDNEHGDNDGEDDEEDNEQGSCSDITCDAHSVKMDAHHLPEMCEGRNCRKEECCVGTCHGLTCPLGAENLAADLQPSKCDKLPCDLDSCCIGVCTANLCSHHGKVSSNIAQFASGDKCEGVPCKAQECCRGSCADGDICTDQHPPLNSSQVPSECESFECKRSECCQDRCSADVCGKSSESGLTVMAASNLPENCIGGSCTKAECCVAWCSSSHCPLHFGLTLKSEHLACNSTECTKEECCAGVCATSDCPRANGTILKSPTEVPAKCDLLSCTSEECCDARGTCVAHQCPVHLVSNSHAPAHCDGVNCTHTECCAPPGVCDSNTCQNFTSGMHGMVLKLLTELPKVCNADYCTADECCTERHMVYWVEKTSGAIKRCRADRCWHDGVEIVKKGLSLPEGVAFDVKRRMLYWTNTHENAIERCWPDDCEKTSERVIANAGQAMRLAIDHEAGYLYWSEKLSFKVMRSFVNGSWGNREEVLRSGTGGVPEAIAVDPDKNMLYWTGSAQVQRCNMSEGLPCDPHRIQTVAGPSDSLARIVGIALNLKKRTLFFSLEDKIEECPMELGQNQSNIKVITRNVDFVRGLTVDGVTNTLYMAEGVASGRSSRIRSCKMGSCGDAEILINGCPGSGCLNMPFDVALDWSEDTVAKTAQPEISSNSSSPVRNLNNSSSNSSNSSSTYDAEDNELVNKVIALNNTSPAADMSTGQRVEQDQLEDGGDKDGDNDDADTQTFPDDVASDPKAGLKGIAKTASAPSDGCTDDGPFFVDDNSRCRNRRTGRFAKKACCKAEEVDD